MAMPQMLEGTWEEIKRHEAELVGKHVRVFINPDVAPPALPVLGTTQDTTQAKSPSKKLRGFGAYAHIPGGSEAFALEKQKEIEREDRKFERSIRWTHVQ